MRQVIFSGFFCENGVKKFATVLSDQSMSDISEEGKGAEIEKQEHAPTRRCRLNFPLQRGRRDAGDRVFALCSATTSHDQNFKP